MPQFTFDNVEHMLPGQGDTINTLLQALNTGNDGVETVTSGALSTTLYRTILSVTGTQAYTLANGTTVGQRKLIMCETAATIPAGTLTITTPDTTVGYVLPSTFFFDTVGQGLELVWTATGWRAVKAYRAGGTANNVVVGTTVTTSKNLWRGYYLSVTGTVSSTVAANQGIPNGICPGDQCLVGCATAATIPSGTIQLAAVTTLGASGTAKTLGTFNATTCYATLQWDGQFWGLVGNTTVVLS